MEKKQNRTATKYSVFVGTWGGKKSRNRHHVQYFLRPKFGHLDNFKNVFSNMRRDHTQRPKGFVFTFLPGVMSPSSTVLDHIHHSLLQ